MPRRSQKRRRSRRGIAHIPRKRGITPIKVLKYGVALAPPAVATYYGFKSGGAMGAANELEKAFTGIDFQNHTFDAKNLLVGYGGVLGAYAIGKIYNRVLR